MREHKALRAALSTILSVSMVLGSVPTAAIAEVLDEDTPPVVEVVEEGAPEEEAVSVEEEVAPEEAAPVEGEVVPEEEAAPAEAAPAIEEPATVEEVATEEEATPADEPAALELTAASDEEAIVATYEFPTTTTIVDDGEEGDLLGHYVEQLFEEALPGNDEPTMTAQMVELTGKDAVAFNALGPRITEIAHGSRPSTVIEIPVTQFTNKTRYTAAELGVDWIYSSSTQEWNQQALKAAAAIVRPDTSLVLKYLLYSYPYEMYWFDKTEGMQCGGPRFGVSGSGGEYNAITLQGNLEFSFAVAPAYSAGENLVDTSQAARAQVAVERAQGIAAQGASDSPYYRLKLFNDTICSMVSYNDEAAGGGVDYGDPWQLVYVFDDDDTTNVVCEGYSKAFKYLCDLANITGVTCSTMSGTMDGGTGAGAHMWDVVNMDDGKNYLVDVTNCDQGTVGYPYQLFIVPFSSGSVSDGYVFQTESKPITYVYDADMSQLYTNSEMTISDTEYDPSQYDPDAAAAQVVIDQIAALPAVANLTLDNANAVSAARAAYDALTEAQKALVANYETLQAAETKIAELQQAAEDQAAAYGVIEMISHLPAVNRLTLGDQGRVAAARSAFENLTEAQQALVTNYATLQAAEAKIAELQAAADQNAAQQVINAIDALPAVDQLTLGNADAVSQARTAYDELTEAQQALVTNYATLQTAEAKIAELQQQADADAVAAQAVIDAIDGLPAVNQLMLSDASAVSAARTAYDALSEAQKALVTNYETLTAAEAKIAELQAAAADQAAAQAVIDAINGLPAVDQLTLQNASAVSSARAAYDALSETQKALVANYTTLTAAEAKIAELQAAADQQAADQAAADSVIAKIAAIPALSELTLADAGLVTTARTAYDALTDAQKALVTNYETLTGAETRVADLTAAHAVDELIDDLPDTNDLTLEDAEAVEAARDAFAELTEDQKELVELLSVLEEAENRIEYLENSAAAQAVDAKIAALPAVDSLTLNDASAVEDARYDYDALTPAQKDMVQNLATLTAAEAKITQLQQQAAADQAAAQQVTDAIAALPAAAQLTLQNAGAVSAARTAYDALSEAQKALVTNYETLTAAEARIADLTAANAVEVQIAALPAVDDLTLGDAEAVATANSAYAALTDAQKALVQNVDILTAAEAKIAELQAAADEQAANQAAADSVIAKIAAIPALANLTLGDANLVTTARTAYDALTAAQKALVTNYETLTDAEAKIADFTAAHAVDEQIADLPAVEALTLDDADDVAAARAAFDALTDAQKMLVENLDALVDAEERIEELQAAAAQHEIDLAAAKAVDDEIAGLPAGEDLTLEDADAVAAARTAYNALTDTQKGLVQNLATLTAAEARIADLTAAQAVEVKIAALPQVDELTLDDQTQVMTARAAYDDLTEAQQQLVQNYNVLEAAEAKIAELWKQEADKEAASIVDGQIDMLPAVEALTLGDADAVAAVRAAYDELTAEQKAYVTKLDELVAAETRIADLTAAKAVDTKIAELPQVDALTLEDADLVADARSAYEGLTETQKGLVANYDTLTAAEAKISQLQKAAADAAAAKAVDDAIAALPVVDELTLDNQAQVAAARAAYDDLTADQKALVQNLDTLIAAEAKITQLQQAAADAVAAKAVDDAIAALPAVDALTLNDQAQVAAARAAYDALTDAQKALIQNLNTLTAAEARIQELQAAADQHAIDVAAARGVDAKIEALPAVDELTLDNAAAVAEARSAYNALTDTQKGLVEKLSVLEAAEAKIAALQQAADDLAAAQAVDAKINALPAVDELTLDNAAAVAEARSAYNALTDAQKPLVEKLNVLEAAEAKIAELQQAAADAAEAQAVIDAIAALPTVAELTLDDAADVSAARTAYDALTEAQRALVTNYETLTAAEARIADLNAANAVDELIADLPAVDELTLDDADDVAAARTAYDALTDAQKALVEKLGVLEAAEAKIAALQQAADDLAAAQAVDAKINALPAVDELTLDNTAAVAEARDAYDALTDAQKALVEKLGVLEAAEAKIAALQQAADDLAAAQAVDAKINALPAVNELTLDDADAVTAARAAYDALTDAQKALVEKLGVLEVAEAKISQLQQAAADAAAAKAVDDAIAALPAVDELTLADVDDVTAARTAYNALTDAQKPLVTKLDVLTAAEAKIAELQQQAEDQAAAQPVIDAIAALPAVDELALADAADVSAVRTTYNTLTDAQKALVTNYDTLTAAEARIADLTAANAVDEQIADLPAVDQLTLGDAEDVSAARAAYDALTDVQQALVTNYPVLKAAEQKIADLQQAAADQAAAQPVIDAIAALSPTEELTLDDADEVAAARSAYDALTDAQKALVTNYETLAAAEAKIASIHIPLTDAVVEVAKKTYNGKAQTPKVTVTLNGAELTEGTDFTVSHDDCINVGNYEVTVIGTGRYEGEVAGTFAITRKAVTVTADDLSKTYGEDDPELTATVTGTLGSDTVNYTLARAEGENVGEYAITPTSTAAQGNYTVTFVAGTFTIAAKDISTATVPSIGAKTYTGSALKPAPTVKDNGTKLVKGTDYTVSYKNNTKAGTATVTITGKGNYTGTKTATFKIKPKSIAASSVTVSSIAKQKWTGKAIKPTPVVKDGTKTLKSGTDYKLTYKNNKEPGTATITITGIGNYTGARTTTFRIGAKTGTWKKSGSKWWYQYADNTYPKNQFADIDGARYYFDGSGYMVTGWKKVGNYWYYFRSDGKMGANDWAKSGSKWCFLDSVGRMVTGWRTISNVRYYFDANGYMVTGWKTISGKDYYFKSSGAMAKSEWIGNYYVGADGAWVKGKTK